MVPLLPATYALALPCPTSSGADLQCPVTAFFEPDAGSLALQIIMGADIPSP
jgi:hypothetical protein